MSRRRLTAIVAGLVILLALIVRVVVGGSRGPSDIAVDTTGGSARATAASRVVQATVAAKPLLVVSPRTVRHGASIGLWGSGFPGGATVDIYLKREASDSVNPVTVVEADKNGQFGGVSVSIPDSLSSGSLIIQAKEYQGSLTAMATATVTDGADEPQPLTQTTTTPASAAAATPASAAAATPTSAAAATATAAAAATPTSAAAATPTSAAAATPTTAAAATPTTAMVATATAAVPATPTAAAPATPTTAAAATPTTAMVATATAAVRATPTAAAAASPTAASKVAAQPQPTPQPHPTPQSKPTEQPRTTPQSQPTPQSKPTQQPQRTPQSKPTAQPQPTPQSKPTEQPRPTPQSKPTEQPRPTPQSKPTEQPRPTPQPQPKPETHHTSLAPSSYTVQAGDNLSAIAEQVYGDANEWRSLYEANREAIGANPNLVHPGTELVVPPKD